MISKLLLNCANSTMDNDKVYIELSFYSIRGPEKPQDSKPVNWSVHVDMKYTVNKCIGPYWSYLYKDHQINENTLPIYITGPCGNATWSDEWANSGVTSFVNNFTGCTKPPFSLHTAAIGESNWWLHNTTSVSVASRVFTAATSPLGMDTRRFHSVNNSASSAEQWASSSSFKTASKKLTSCCPTEKFHLKHKTIRKQASVMTD